VFRAELSTHFARHYGVIHRRQATALGVTRSELAGLLQSGRWRRVHGRVYRLADAPDTPMSRVAAACLAGGTESVASHLSALWLWDLVVRPPDLPVISVTRRQNPRLAQVVVYRRTDLNPEVVSQRGGVPVTNPLRSLCDAGATVSSGLLDDAIDRALVTRLVTVEGLAAEAARLATRGRVGIRDLRAALARRGMVGAPQPSVLESRTLRVLAAAGIRPTDCQVAAAAGAYRLDFLLRPGLALEVDGFAYHSSPEAKSADSRRRNRLRLAGLVVIESDWTEVVRHPARFTATVQAALSEFGRGPPGQARSLSAAGARPGWSGRP
jgi:very-short-patch-repair endonuclease